MADLFRRHPPPWAIHSGVIFDANGKMVDVGQAQVRAELVEAVNALKIVVKRSSTRATKSSGRSSP